MEFFFVFEKNMMLELKSACNPYSTLEFDSNLVVLIECYMEKEKKRDLIKF
jgi:hypothetical protein